MLSACCSVLLAASKQNPTSTMQATNHTGAARTGYACCLPPHGPLAHPCAVSSVGVFSWLICWLSSGCMSFTSRGYHITCSLLSGVPRRLVSKVMSKQADERASEKGDDRTNEKAERYVWRAFRDIAHHVFGLHIAARHTAQCSHAACTIQRAWRRAVAREWGMPSLLDSKDALGAPWLGLEHAYHNSQCRQNDRRLRYIPIIMRLHSVLFLIGWLVSLQSLLYLYRGTGHVACSLRSVMSMSKPTAF